MTGTDRFRLDHWLQDRVLRGLIAGLRLLPYRWRVPLCGWVMARVIAPLAGYDRRLVDGCMVTSAAMRAISADLAAKSPAERALQPCIGHDRADLVVAGCAILEAILDAWPAETIRVADRGIREGILRTLIARDGGRG